MAEPFDTQAAALASALGLTRDAGQLADLSAVLEAQYPDILTQLKQAMTFLGKTGGSLGHVTAPPTNDMGAPGDYLINRVDKILYGPKDAVTGWPAGDPFLKGDPGDSAVISEVTVSTGAAGSNALVVMGGTPLARTIAFTIPRGNPGLTPNITAAVTMIANGSPPVVTKSGTDAAPTLTFQLPAPRNGTDGREVEIQANATHIQLRYVGDPTWTDLISLATLKGGKGDKGDAFKVDATGSGLTARAVYDAEAEGFSYVDTATGLIYFRQTSTWGMWSAGVPFGAAQSAILDALAALDSAPGLLLQVDGDTITKRAIGAAADNQILDRTAADSRYRRNDQGVPLGDVAGAQAALDEKADAAAVIASLANKADAAEMEALDVRVTALEAAPAAVSSVAGLSGAVSTAALLAALGLLRVEVQQGFTLAELKGSIQLLSSGVADSFADGMGISSLGAFRRLLGRLTNTVALTTPTLTGDTTSGWSAGSNDNSYRPAYRAFDKNASTAYTPNNGLTGSNTKTIELAVPGPTRVREYSIQALAANNAPTTWTLEASNDGTSWETLDSRTGITGWTAGLTRTYTIAIPDFYSRLRWSFTAVQSGVVLEVAEIALTGDGPTGTSTVVQSATFATGSAPTTATLTVQARRLDAALTINTDLIGWVSRNGGANWTQVILAATVTAGGVTTYDGSADLSGQPSASSVRWKLDVSSAPIEIAGVALQWA